jgi:hypothetical protein
MSAVLSLRGEIQGEQELCWLAPEGDEESWLMVRAERRRDGLVVQIPVRTRLFGAASLHGRALLMTPAGTAWLEQPCASSVLGETGDTATLLLRPEGPAVRVEVATGAIPRT